MPSMQLSLSEKHRLKKGDKSVKSIEKKGRVRGHEEINPGRPDMNFPEEISQVKRGREWSRPWKQQVLSLQEIGAFDHVTGTWTNESKDTNLETGVGWGDQGGSLSPVRMLNFLPSGGPLSVKQGIVTIRRAFFKHHSRCSEEDGGGPAWVWLLQDWWWWRVMCLGLGEWHQRWQEDKFTAPKKVVVFQASPLTTTAWN